MGVANFRRSFVKMSSAKRARSSPATRLAYVAIAFGINADAAYEDGVRAVRAGAIPGASFVRPDRPPRCFPAPPPMYSIPEQGPAAGFEGLYAQPTRPEFADAARALPSPFADQSPALPAHVRAAVEWPRHA